MYRQNGIHGKVKINTGWQTDSTISPESSLLSRYSISIWTFVQFKINWTQVNKERLQLKLFFFTFFSVFLFSRKMLFLRNSGAIWTHESPPLRKVLPYKSWWTSEASRNPPGWKRDNVCMSSIPTGWKCCHRINEPLRIWLVPSKLRQRINEAKADRQPCGWLMVREALLCIKHICLHQTHLQVPSTIVPPCTYLYFLYLLVIPCTGYNVPLRSPFESSCT